MTNGTWVPTLAERVSIEPMSYFPQRGDAIWLTVDPKADDNRRRPALVISPLIYNGRANLALICPITSQVKNYPFEVAIPDGLPISGAILADQIRNLDWQARKATFIARLPDAVLADVLKKLEPLLAM